MVVDALRSAASEIGVGVRAAQLPFHDGVMEPGAPEAAPYREAIRVLEGELARLRSLVGELVGGQP